MFTVDAALQHTCASFRERATRGEITEAECDLLVDGAILLALHIEALERDAYAAEALAAEALAAEAGRGHAAGTHGRHAA